MTNNEIQQQHQQQLLILNSNSYSQQAASMNLNQTHNNHHQHQHHQPPPQQQQQQQQQNQHHHHHQQALQQTQPQHHQHHNQQQQQQHLNQNHHQLHQHHHNSHNNHQHHASHNHSHRGQQQASANGDGNANQMLKKELPANGKKTKGRVRIKMEFIHNKLRRYTTFSKRKTGIMKKAFELATLTGTQVMLLVASETGHVYTFATRKLQPMIISDAGKALIQTCLNSPDSDNLLISASAAAAAAAAASSTATPNSNGCNNASNSGNLAPSTTTTAAQATPTAGATNATATPASVGPSHSMVSGQLSPLSSSHGASTPNSGSPPNQQRAPVSGNEHVEQQQQQLYADSSLNSQKSLNLNLNLGQASNGNCSSSSSVNNIQSQHNMLLAAASSTPSSSSSPSNCSLGPATNAHLSNQHITNTNSNNSNNSGHSTTDQRMSATGFEETELSYSINDDLNDRTFNNCLPISIGTISNNGGANVPSGNSTSTSTSIITSSQAFEQTLKDHRQADNLIESVYLHNGYNNNDGTNDESIVTALENPNQNRVQIVGNRRLVHQHGNKNYTIDSDTQFHARMPQNLSGPLRDPSIEFQLAQFNYNPLYTGLQQQQQQQTRLNQQQSVGLNSQQQHKREKQSRQLNNLMIDNQISQQQQQQQQMNFQQQFTLVSSSNNSNTQLDLSEECGGLFVEYQTNRVNSMGDLEELNSLNVTNCVDSEALEEQINMLSSSSDRHNHQNLVEGNEEEEDDDCFASNDDLNDFGIGSSNDHFLNMLFLGGNGNSASAGSNGNLEAFASNQQDIMQQQGGNNVGLSFDSHQSEQNQQQSLICNQVGETGLNNNINANSSHQHQLQIQQQTDKGGARRRQEANKLAIVNKVTNTRKRSKRNDRSSENSIATAQQAPSQNKINTTNTNKRLLPKKNQQQQQPGLASNGNKTCVKKIRCARNVWSASPSSSTTSASNSSHSGSAMLSPSSSSQFEYDQAPYRQQLENLRKKLKMDAPNSISLIPVLQNKGCQLKDQNQEELLSPQQATSATGILVNCQTQNQLEANQVMLVASEPQYLIARTIEQFEAGSLIYFSGPNGISQPIDTETSPSGDTRNQGQQAPEPLKHSNDMSSKQGSSQVPLIAETPPGSSDQMNSQQDFVSTEIGSEQMQTNESLNTNGSKNTSVANRGPKPLMNSNGQEQAERVRASHSRGEKLESQQMSLFCSGQHDQQQQSSSILLEDVVNIVETSCSSSNATSTNDQCNVSAAEPPTISMETNILDRLPILQFRDQPKSIALEERLL